MTRIASQSDQNAQVRPTLIMDPIAENSNRQRYVFQDDMQILTCKNPETIPIETRDQLVDYLAAACKAPEEFRLGVEQEMFVYSGDDYRPAEYDGSRPGIKALLESMLQFGWSPIEENGLLIGLHRGDRAITVEPGGQIELSGPAVRDAHQVLEGSQAYQDELRMVGDELGLHFLAMGCQPKHRQSELPWMPKDRYRIMRAYMPSRGSMGLQMMQSTCALQVSLDFDSEADMVKKFRVALALQPLVAAIFANSPFAHGGDSGKLSYRNRIWRDTDPDRCGSLPFVFETGMGFERYADYVLDVPMYFVHRDGQYIDASGSSFRDFLAGRLTVLPGEPPLISDWANHLTTVFPQVRLKNYLEMRGADAGGSIWRAAALSALWAGLLYDGDALDEAWERVRAWTPDERNELEFWVAKHGFNLPFRGQSVQDLCLWILRLSRQGLLRRDYRNQNGQNESQYLEPLRDAVQSGRTFAKDLIQRFEQQWRGDIDVAVASMCQETMS
jgi:glutamate--cysteine ligase